MSQEDVLCIGIDLGTTNSVMAYVDKNGFPQVILNSESENVTPSVVYWEQDEAGLITATVGDDAVKYSYIRPEQTVKSIKWDMGENKTIKIFGHQMTPEEISSLILMKLKDDAEAHFQREVTHTIITVPAYFGTKERVATQTAAMLAGWKKENLQIMNEPTAARYSFVFDRLSSQQEIKNGEKVLIFDLGGDTFDCTIFEYIRESENKPGFLYEITKNGDNKLGGDDFDEVVFQWVRDEHQKETGIDIREDLNATADVMKSVKNAKESLSKREKRKIIVDLKPPLSVELTREKFDELCEGLYQKVNDIVDKTLKREHLKNPAPINPEDINSVVMVGGSSRIKAMGEMVQKKFPTADIFLYHVDFAVAFGAALYALCYFPQTDEKMIEISRKQIISFYYGARYYYDIFFVQTSEGNYKEINFVPVINSDNPTSGSGSIEIPTDEDNAENVTFKIYNGCVETERPLYNGCYDNSIRDYPITDCNFIAKIKVSGLPPAPCGKEIIRFDFKLDKNTLNVVSTILSTGKTSNKVISMKMAQNHEVVDKRDELREQLPKTEY